MCSEWAAESKCNRVNVKPTLKTSVSPRLIETRVTTTHSVFFFPLMNLAANHISV